MLQEQELANLKLEKGLINQQEFDTAIRELSEANRILNKEIDDEREAIEKQEKAEFRALRKIITRWQDKISAYNKATYKIQTNTIKE